MEIILARHGNTFDKGDTVVQVGAKTDMSLTSKGIEQAAELARFLKQNNLTPRHIFSGPLARHKQTAQIVLEAFNSVTIPYTIHTAFNEIDYGNWEGLTSEEITAKWPSEYEQWTHYANWPVGVFKGQIENHIAELQAWVKSLLPISTQSALSSQPILVITSNGLLKLFLNLIPSLWTRAIEAGTFEDYKVKTGSICSIQLHPENAGSSNIDKLLTINYWNRTP